MKRFTSFMLALAVVGITALAFAQDSWAAKRPEHKVVTYGQRQMENAIFNAHTGREPGSLGSGAQAAKRPAHKVVTHSQLEMGKWIYNSKTGQEPGSLTSFLGGGEKPKTRAANSDRIFTQWEAEEVSS